MAEKEDARDALLRQLASGGGGFALEGEGVTHERALDVRVPPAEPDEDDKKKEERPEDAIPDRPENEATRKFLANAPSKGLWMPMGLEVKVMQCWRCKAYGHRTGDRECPLNQMGNVVLESERLARDDPLAAFGVPKRKREDDGAAGMLGSLIADIRAERKEKKRKKEKKKKKKKKEKKKKKKKKKAASSSSSSSSSSSDSD